jgi:hypothetical protein
MQTNTNIRILVEQDKDDSLHEALTNLLNYSEDPETLSNINFHEVLDQLNLLAINQQAKKCMVIINEFINYCNTPSFDFNPPSTILINSNTTQALTATSLSK